MYILPSYAISIINLTVLERFGLLAYHIGHRLYINKHVTRKPAIKYNNKSKNIFIHSNQLLWYVKDQQCFTNRKHGFYKLMIHDGTNVIRDIVVVPSGNHGTKQPTLYHKVVSPGEQSTVQSVEIL